MEDIRKVDSICTDKERLGLIKSKQAQIKRLYDWVDKLEKEVNTLLIRVKPINKTTYLL